MNEFVYLGSLVTADTIVSTVPTLMYGTPVCRCKQSPNDSFTVSTTSLEIQNRIQAGNLAYFGLRKTLTSDKKLKNYKASGKEGIEAELIKISETVKIWDPE